MLADRAPNPSLQPICYDRLCRPRQVAEFIHYASRRPVPLSSEQFLDPTFSATSAIFTLNVLWFGAGFWQFSLRSESAAKIIVPKVLRSSPLFRTLSVSIRFLGGLNLALSLLAILVLANLKMFPEARQIALFAIVFAVAHGTQFFVNVPVALGGRKAGGSPWHVLSGPMLSIFAIDFVLMVCNSILAVALWAAQ